MFTCLVSSCLVLSRFVVSRPVSSRLVLCRLVLSCKRVIGGIGIRVVLDLFLKLGKGKIQWLPSVNLSGARDN